MEGPVWKRVVRKNRKLARILGEQWTGISAVRFLLIFWYICSTVQWGKNMPVPSLSREGCYQQGNTSRSPLLCSCYSARISMRRCWKNWIVTIPATWRTWSKCLRAVRRQSASGCASLRRCFWICTSISTSPLVKGTGPDAEGNSASLEYLGSGEGCQSWCLWKLLACISHISFFPLPSVSQNSHLVSLEWPVLESVTADSARLSREDFLPSNPFFFTAVQYCPVCVLPSCEMPPCYM